MSARVYRQQWITRKNVRDQPSVLFVFGDNMQRRGLAGQAKAMRGEPNAIGVPTKWAPDTRQESYFSDDDFEDVRPSIDAVFNRLRREIERGLDVVIPADGLGTGLADLPARAPRIHSYIEGKIADLAAWAAAIGARP